MVFWLMIQKLDMEANKPSQGIYPLHRCKTIHLVRHAQGIHNVEGEKNHDAYLSEDLFDAHLTPLGWEQVPYSFAFSYFNFAYTFFLSNCMNHVHYEFF